MGPWHVRESLVQTRTKYISLVRALLRREGLRVRPGSSSSFCERVGELEIPEHLQREIAPILKLMIPLNRQIEADRTINPHFRNPDL